MMRYLKLQTEPRTQSIHRFTNDEDSREWLLVLSSEAFKEVMFSEAWVPDGSTSNYQTRHMSNTEKTSWNESLPFFRCPFSLWFQVQHQKQLCKYGCPPAPRPPYPATSPHHPRKSRQYSGTGTARESPFIRKWSYRMYLCHVHSLSCMRDVWILRLEASHILFRILIVFIPYFILYFYKNFSSLCTLNTKILWKLFILLGQNTFTQYFWSIHPLILKIN